jgi:hypothetical protein
MLHEPSAGAEAAGMLHIPFVPSLDATMPLHVGAAPTPQVHEHVEGVSIGSTSTVAARSDVGHEDCDAGSPGANATKDQPPGGGSTHA